jgi:Type IV secretion system pilin
MSVPLFRVRQVAADHPTVPTSSARFLRTSRDVGGDRPPSLRWVGRAGAVAATSLVLAVGVAVLTPAVAYAATGGGVAAVAAARGSFASTAAMLAVNDLPTIVSNLRTWVMGILAALATLFLTIGGVRYLMAGGDPSEVERAKAAFRSAAMGYCLAVIAPVVLTVLQSIIGS